MAKISKKTIEELEDILNRGCDYADTQTVVTEYANEALKESGCELCQCDDAMVVDWDEDTVCTVEEFANIFWDKAVEGMIRILLSSRLGDRKWTQADLARKTGIRPTTINELYHEMVDRVNLDHLDLICEALDCSLDELIVRVPNKTPRTTHTINGSQKSKIDE